MGKFSREKGKAGEREAARAIHDITGWEIKRRVRQHQGDSDLDVTGTPLDKWTVEVKRYAKATRGDIAGWWDQAVSEAEAIEGTRPVLLFRVDRDEWRAVWSRPGVDDHKYGWTHEGNLYAWIEVVMESQP